MNEPATVDSVLVSVMPVQVIQGVSAKKWTSTERGLELMSMHPDDLSQSQHLPEGKDPWYFIEPACALSWDFQQANSRVHQ